MFTAILNMKKDEQYDAQGRRQGKSKVLYEDGQLESISWFKDNTIQGEHKAWHENGILKRHCYYKDGLMHGDYKWYYSTTGDLGERSNYENGQLHGHKQIMHHSMVTSHQFFQHGIHITSLVKPHIKDISDITEEEKLIIKLKFGINCINKEGNNDN